MSELPLHLAHESTSSPGTQEWAHALGREIFLEGGGGGLCARYLCSTPSHQLESFGCPCGLPYFSPVPSHTMKLDPFMKSQLASCNQLDLQIVSRND